MSNHYEIGDRVLVNVSRSPTDWLAGTVASPLRCDGTWTVALDEGWSAWATIDRLRHMSAVQRLADLTP